MPGCLPPQCVSTYEGHYYEPYVQQDTTSGWPVFGRATVSGYPAHVDSVLRGIGTARTTPEVVRAAAQLGLRYPMAQRLQRLIDARTPPNRALQPTNAGTMVGAPAARFVESVRS